MNGTCSDSFKQSFKCAHQYNGNKYELIQFGHLTKMTESQAGWGSRIHQLLLFRGVTPLSNECPGYSTKQSDGKAPVMLELLGMQSTPSLSSLPGPLWPKVVAFDKVLSMGQIELFDRVQTSHLC